MPAGTNRSISYVAYIAVFVPILIGAYFASFSFLPMYWWTKVDLAKISASSGISQSSLETKYELEMRYNPRGEGDPLPWQIITMKPAWAAEDEAELLVRCTFISQNDGQPPSTTFINNTFKDRYFKVTACRLPPGSLGFNAKRPVVIYERMSLEKMSITDAIQNQSAVQVWESDDLWDKRDDGWEPADQP